MCAWSPRNGFDFADRSPLVVEALAGLPVHSCVLDGEAIAVNDAGLSVFDLIRCRQQDHAVTLCAFDLLELDGEDLRHTPIETRKATLKSLLRRSHNGVAFNQHSRPTATRSTDKLVRSVAKASCQNDSAGPIGPVEPTCG